LARRQRYVDRVKCAVYNNDRPAAHPFIFFLLLTA
jgi:hypothetical protein